MRHHRPASHMRPMWQSAVPHYKDNFKSRLHIERTAYCCCQHTCQCTCRCTYCHVPVLYCTVLYCTVLYCTVLYCTVLYCTVLYCTVLYCTVLYCTVLYCTVLYCTVLYCTVLYCTVLYCTVPNYVTTTDWNKNLRGSRYWPRDYDSGDKKTYFLREGSF